MGIRWLSCGCISLLIYGCFNDSGGEYSKLHRGISCQVKLDATVAFVPVFDVVEENDKSRGKTSKVIGQGVECAAIRKDTVIGSTSRLTSNYEGTCEF